MPVRVDFLKSDDPLLVRPDTNEHRVLHAIDNSTHTATDTLTAQTGLSSSQITGALERLRKKGLVTRDADGAFILSNGLAERNLHALKSLDEVGK